METYKDDIEYNDVSLPINSSSKVCTNAPQAPLDMILTSSALTLSLGASSAHFLPVLHSPV